MSHTVYLIRHGEPLFNGDVHRCLGLTDVALTEYGKREALKLQEWFRDKGIQSIYTSRLKRCKQTAEIIADKKNAGDSRRWFGRNGCWSVGKYDIC